MDAYTNYSSGLDALVSLPGLLDQQLSAIEASQRSSAADLDREQQRADATVADSRRVVGDVLKDARDVLSAIDLSGKVPTSVRADAAASGDPAQLKAALAQAAEGVRLAVIDEQRRRRDEAARARADAAEAERRRLEAERQRREQLERERLEAERRARQRALALRAGAAVAVLLAIAIVVLLLI
jgi:hypothetical protein